MEQTVYKKVDLNEAVKYNSAAVKSVSIHKNRDKFFKAFKQQQNSVTKLIEKYYDTKSFRKILSYKIRTELKKLLK